MKMLFCTLLIAIVGCSGTESEHANSPTSPTEPTAAMDAATPTNESATDTATPLIVDVRSQEEWDSGHVQRAVHIPHTEIVDRIGEVTTDKDAKIVVYCAAGGRAGKAKQALEQEGFSNVENGGGYDDVKQRFE